MEITIEYLKAQAAEYEKAVKEHENLMHANYGALEAVSVIIKELQKKDVKMWIKFTKEAAANERVYHKGDTALFQDELGQKMVEGGFAEYFDPGNTLIIGEFPKAEGLEGENVAPEPVAVDGKGVIVDSKGVAKDAPEPKPEKHSKK